MRKKYIILIGGISLLFLTGCVSSKKMTYMYKGEKVLTGNQTSFLYDARIMPKDLLTITVSYSEPELAAPFNICLLYTSPSPRDRSLSRMPSSA